MARKTGQKRADDTVADVENVDKIREILFGGKMRDYEQRFVELEKRLVRSIEQTSAKFEKQIERIDAYAKREIDKISEQVKAERKARLDEGRSGARELKEFSQQVEGWFAEVEEQIEGDTRELRAALAEYNDELSGLIQETHDQLAKNIDESNELASSKVANDDLARLFSEIAERVKKASKRSGG